MTAVTQGTSITLEATFFAYPSGPATDLTGTTIKIETSDGVTTVLGPTSTGVSHPATGTYTYTWSVGLTQAAGDYLVVWSGTSGGSTITASEIVTVTAASAGGTGATADVWYCTREDVKQALDYKETARNNAQVDRCIQAASRAIDGGDHVGGLLKRRFYPTQGTRYFDWPNFQYAYPWRLWLDKDELASYSDAVVTTGGVTIPAANLFFEPINSGPPYTYIEINRSTSSAFGVGTTPQRDIAITGTWGYWTATDPAGTLAAAVSDTTGTSVQVSDSSLVGVGDAIKVDSEWMIVTGRSMITTSQTQQGTGVSTASSSDVTLAVTDGTKYAVGEILLLDSERMLIVDIAGNNLTVKRAWDGSVLATHSGATVYAGRQLTVTRGALGTTAATHANTATVVKNKVPGPVKELCIAYACAYLTGESSAYAKQFGEGQGAATNLGRSISQLEADVVTAYGRKNRRRAI